MAIYKSYVEAVIANGSVKGVRCAMISNDGRDGVFGLERDFSNVTAKTILCHPSDYLQTLADFLESGMSLVNGDKYTGRYGDVVDVQTHNLSTANTPLFGDETRFVVKAAAYDTETPEEKEAFDAIPNQTTIDAMNDKPCSEVYDDANDAFSYCVNGGEDLIESDTPEGQWTFDAMTYAAPQQVESLSSSEKPNNSEWNGEGLPPVGVEFDFSSNGISWEPRIMLFNDGITCLMAHREYPENRWHYKCDDPDLHFRKPETPEQRAERERLEAAYELYLNECAHARYLPGKIDAVDLSFYLRIVDKTGYRKQ